MARYILAQPVYVPATTILPPTFDPAKMDWSDLSPSWTQRGSNLWAPDSNFMDGRDPPVIEVLGTSTTGPQLNTRINAKASDIIVLTKGTYASFNRMDCNVDRSARPVEVIGNGLVTLQQGAGSAGAMYFGLGGHADTITVRNVTIDGYAIGSTGIVYCANTSGMKFYDVTISNCTGSASTSHGFYLSSDGGAGSDDLTIQDCDVSQGAGVRTLTAVQSYHNPNTRTPVYLTRVTGTNLYMTFLLWGDASGFIIDGGSSTSCTRSFDNAGDGTGRGAGTIGNFVATGSVTARVLGGPMTDLGTNSWDK